MKADMLRLSRPERLARLAGRCRHNADALMASLEFCARHGIGAFRVNSQILPVTTPPQAGYKIKELPSSRAIIARFRECASLPAGRLER